MHREKKKHGGNNFYFLVKYLVEDKSY